MNKLAVVITAYKQWENCIRQIKSIPNGIPIIIVSTAEDCSIFYDNMGDYFTDSNVFFIPLEDSPGNPKCNWWISPPRRELYPSFRAEFLPPRILYSMEFGFKKAIEIGCEFALHIHSDIFKDYTLIDQEIERTKDKVALIDCNSHEELEPKRGSYIGCGTHWMPENQLINLKKAQEIGYINLSKIYDKNTNFRYHDPSCIEGLFGLWAYYCLTGKNAITPKEILDPIFYDQFQVRCIRNHHGDFPEVGLKCLFGEQ